MPEYLAPGVYVEETSFRAKTIEGVGTSTAGFVGPARFGPVGGEPELLTSFGDFERIYGGVDRLLFDEQSDESENYLAHAVRAFFDNGGSRLYVTRIYGDGSDPQAGFASLGVGGSPADVTLRARFPGRAGEMRITFALRMGANILVSRGGTPVLSGARLHDTVFVTRGLDPVMAPGVGGFCDVVMADGEMALADGDTPVAVSTLTPGTDRVHAVTVLVSVLRPGRFEVDQPLGEFSPDPDHRSALTAYFAKAPGSRARDLSVPFWIDTSLTSGREIVARLMGDAIEEALRRQLATDSELTGASPDAERPAAAELQKSHILRNGGDGAMPTHGAYKGGEIGARKTGLESFVDIEDIAIVAAPGATMGYDSGNQSRAEQITQHLLTHVAVS